MPREGILGGFYFDELIYELYCFRNSRVFSSAVIEGVTRGILDGEFTNEIRAHEIAVTPYQEWGPIFDEMDLGTLRNTLRAMDNVGLKEAGKLVGHPRLYSDRKANWSHDESISVAAAFHTSWVAVSGNRFVEDIPWYHLTKTVNLERFSNWMVYGAYHLEGSICCGVSVRRIRGWAEISLVVQATPPGFFSQWPLQLDEIRERCEIPDAPARKKIWAISYPKACRTPLWVFQLFVPRIFPDLGYVLPKLLARNVTSVSVGVNNPIELPWQSPKVVLENLVQLGIDLPPSYSSLRV